MGLKYVLLSSIPDRGRVTIFCVIQVYKFDRPTGFSGQSTRRATYSSHNALTGPFPPTMMIQQPNSVNVVWLLMINNYILLEHPNWWPGLEYWI